MPEVEPEVLFMSDDEDVVPEVEPEVVAPEEASRLQAERTNAALKAATEKNDSGAKGCFFIAGKVNG
ncbi:hypothetical protein [Hymenobacter koreensis]